MPAGVVLTGGGAKLCGIVDLAKQELKLPAQVGFPTELPTSLDKIDDPTFACVVGLLIWGASHEGKGRMPQVPLGKSIGQIKKWFKHILP